MRYRILTLVSLMVMACTPGTSSREAPRPNIVLILADDMGYSDLGCYGSEIATPVLDSLAGNGVRFTQFYNAARCCPTRASLLTGLYPHRAGVGKMVQSIDQNRPKGPFQGYLNDSSLTLAEALKVAGYQTFMSGKWHVGEKPEHWPRQRGFDRYFGLISGASSYYELIKDQPRHRQMAMDDSSWTPPAEGFYMTDAFSEQAVTYIETAGEDPFFLYLAYTAPHWPLHAPAEEVAKQGTRYEAGWDSLRAERWQRQRDMGLFNQEHELVARAPGIPAWPDRDDKPWAEYMATYAAMITRMDAGIGQVMQALRAKGIADNTLVIFLSDNGGCAEDISRRGLNDPAVAVGARGSYVAYKEPWAQVSNTPFRRYKADTYEGGMATPAILHWPGQVPSGHTDHQPLHIVDVMPTLLALAGTSYPEKSSLKRLDGQNFWPWLSDNEIKPRQLAWEHFGQKALRSGDWKIVQPKQAPWELYHIPTDRTESRNLADERVALLDSLTMVYDRWEANGYHFE